MYAITVSLFISTLLLTPLLTFAAWKWGGRAERSAAAFVILMFVAFALVDRLTGYGGVRSQLLLGLDGFYAVGLFVMALVYAKNGWARACCSRAPNFPCTPTTS